MKNSSLLFCSVLLLAFSVSPLAARDDDQTAVAAVMAADRARGVALLAADVKALEALLADDLRYTHSTGKLETKAVHLGTIVDGLRYERFVTSGVHAHVITPDVVVLTGVLDQRKGSGAKWTDYHLLFQGVWRHDAGGWRLTSLQTAVPPPPAP